MGNMVISKVISQRDDARRAAASARDVEQGGGGRDARQKGDEEGAAEGEAGEAAAEADDETDDELRLESNEEVVGEGEQPGSETEGEQPSIPLWAQVHCSPGTWAMSTCAGRRFRSGTCISSHCIVCRHLRRRRLVEMAKILRQ